MLQNWMLQLGFSGKKPRIADETNLVSQKHSSYTPTQGPLSNGAANGVQNAEVNGAKASPDSHPQVQGSPLIACIWACINDSNLLSFLPGSLKSWC